MERPFRGERRPPYLPQYGNADLSLICRTAGLDPAIYATQDFVLHKGLPALFELFSDGEVIVQHRDRIVASNVDPSIRHGDFYAKMSQLWIDAQNSPNSPIDNELSKLARFCGTVYAHTVAEGRQPIAGTQSEVQITGNRLQPAIRFAGYKLGISSGMSIVDIGPGHVGRQFIELQASMIRLGKFIQYIAISRGPFINQFLMDYGFELFRRDQRLPAFQELVKLGFFVGREDGIPAALEELLDTPQPSGKNDIFDYIICNGLGNAKREDLLEGIRLVPEFLKPGGYLLLGLPIERLHTDSARFEEAWDAVSGSLTTVHQVTKITGSMLTGRSTTSTFVVLQR